MRVSTTDCVARSQVFRLWSQEVEYATLGSEGAKVTPETGAVWEVRSARGPRWGAVGAGALCEESFRRLLDVASGRRCGGAAVALDLDVDQMPTEWSAEAERMREEGAWTARLSIDAL